LLVGEQSSTADVARPLHTI